MVRSSLLFCALIWISAATLDAQKLVWRGSPEVTTLGEALTIDLVLSGGSPAAALGVLPRSPSFDFSVGRAKTSEDGSERAWPVRFEARVTGELKLPRFGVTQDGRTLLSPERSIRVRRDDTAPSSLSLRVVDLPATVYRGQIFETRLRLELPRELLRTSLLQPFQQELDLPLRLRSLRGRFGEKDGVVFVPSETAEVSEGLSFVVDDSLCRRSPVEPGSGVDMNLLAVDHVHRWRAERSGELKLPPIWAAVVHAMKFEEDFLRGRVPVDRRESFVYAPPQSLQVLDWPTKGRPKTFAGAVGDFELKARADRKRLEVGETLSLELEISGVGNFDAFEHPGWTSMPGFHVQGRIESSTEKGRLRRYELLALAPGRFTVPPLEFSFFDPEAGARYRTLVSAPIEIVVEGDAEMATDSSGEAASEETSVSARVESSRRDIVDRADFGVALIREDRRFGSRILAWALWLAPLILAFSLGVLAWRRARARRHPWRHRRRQSRRAFRRALTSESGVAAEDLANYLGAHVGRTAAAMYGPDLPSLLRERGLEEGLISETCRTLRAMTEPAYGGPGEKPGPEKLRGLFRRLEESLSTDERALAEEASSLPATVIRSLSFLVFALALVAEARTPADQDAAASAYRSGQFERARTLWLEDLASQPSPSGHLLFSLGNASYRSGRPAEALAFYRRAQLRHPDSEVLRNNITVSERSLGFSPPEPESLAGVLEFVRARVPAAQLLWAFALVAGGGFWFLFARGTKRRRQVAVLLLILAAVGTFLYGRDALLGAPTEGVVQIRDAAVRSEPTSSHPITRSLRLGETVIVRESSDRWSRIETHDDGVSGWVATENIAVIR